MTLLLTIAAVAGSGSADGSDELYTARTIVTGQGERDRGRGFAVTLEAVLVKVSGDPRLIGDPRVAAAGHEAGTYVADFGYRDRMAGIPVHDEQGTRDRPYDLTVRFRPDRIDTLLRSLGRAPWPTPRPRVAVFLTVEQGGVRYRLASDGKRGLSQRESLAAAADGVGLPLVLPDEALLATLGSSPEAADAATLGEPAKAVGGDVALAGRLIWSERDLGWNADWRLAAAGRTHAWRISGVNFDEAFRHGMRGTAQVLSGNGEPR